MKSPAPITVDEWQSALEQLEPPQATGGTTARELAARHGIAFTTATAKIDKLVKAGLAKFIGVRRDGRKRSKAYELIRSARLK